MLRTKNLVCVDLCNIARRVWLEMMASAKKMGQHWAWKSIESD